MNEIPDLLSRVKVVSEPTMTTHTLMDADLDLVARLAPGIGVVTGEPRLDAVLAGLQAGEDDRRLAVGRRRGLQVAAPVAQ